MHAHDLIARFAFSFLIVGIALAWTGHSAAKAGRGTRAAMADAGAVALIVTGFVGVKLRHRAGRSANGPGTSAARDKVRDLESDDSPPPVS